MATAEKVCLIMIKQFDIHGAKCIEMGPVGLVKRSNFDMQKNGNLKYLRYLNFAKCKCKK